MLLVYTKEVFLHYYMAKKTKQTKSKAKSKDDAIVVDDTQSDSDADVAGTSTPTSVEAAYWQEKVNQDGRAKSVEEYTANIVVTAKPNESSEQLLRRFNREVRDLNLIDEIRERLEYEKPSQRRKREKRERAMNMKRYRNWD